MTTSRALRRAIGLTVPLILLAGCGLVPSPGRAPQAVIKASSLHGSAPLVVQLDGSDSTDDREVISYEWSIGDQVLVHEVSCIYTFRASGTYPVRLVVFDADGNMGSATVSVAVDNAPPLASFRLSDNAPWVNVPMVADATGSLDPEGMELTYRWDFGDGGFAEGPNVSHAYAEVGPYVVTLIVRDAAGAEATATHRVLVQSPHPGGGCGGSRPSLHRR